MKMRKSQLVRGFWLLAMAAVLTACGGGGGGTTTSSTTPSTSTSTSTTTPTTPTGTVTVGNTTPTTSVTPDPGTSVLSGVASIGAPLMGATVRIVDGNGARVNLIDAFGAKVPSLKTSTADGSFRFVLATATPTLPLLIQAAGVDGTGMPVVLHSMLNTTTLPQLANITPATDAVVAQVLGTAPQGVFATASTAWPTISLLGSTTAVTSASDQVKNILKNSLTDVKITSTTLDFFRDDSYRANKTLMDAVFEGLRVQIVKDSTGKDQLQVSNKFLAPGIVEVKVSLATARTELLKGSSGTVASAITSTLKANTSPHKNSLANVASVDDLSVALNKLIAQGATSANFLASPVVSPNYTYQDGRSRAATGDLLAAYAVKNNQLGRFLISGCVDDPIASTGCTRFQASALVVDRTGAVVESFVDTIGYTSSTTPNWTLIGNGRQSDVKVFPVAQVKLSPDGTLPAGAPGPGNGIQVVARAQDNASPPAQLLQRATLQVPSGYSALLVYCGLRELCMATNAATPPVVTGELNDSLIQKPSPGWVGSQDAVRGAKFVASVSLMGTATETVTPYLPADVPTDLSLGQFPRPNAPIAPDGLAAGFQLQWGNWADQNPTLRVFMLRIITLDSNGVISLQDFPVANPFANAFNLPATAAAPAFQVWMGAVDNLGRRFYSNLASPPP